LEERTAIGMTGKSPAPTGRPQCGDKDAPQARMA
jgi:hypothetical protein